VNRLTRRQFVVGAGAVGVSAAGLGLLAGCGRWPWQGQEQPAKIPRIGFLATGTREEGAPLIDGFLQGLDEHGYTEGQNIRIDYRFSETQEERLAALAAELVSLPVDLVLASATQATLAAMQVTSTIPVIMASAGDPVATGIVPSLARPGANVTGVSSMNPQLAPKRLELLKEIVPAASRVVTLFNPNHPAVPPQLRELESAASVLGIELRQVEVRSADDFAGAFEAAVRWHADGLVASSDAFLTNHRAQVAELAAAHRLPAVYSHRDFVPVGGLMAYGTNLPAHYRRAAYYVDRILKGAKPADLPVEQPMLFDFVVNMKTAQALGITFPNEIMLQVTEVIE
jgi:putative ABC transport system substrate-binding protein